MTDEDEAQAVLAALANLRPCPYCGRMMDIYHNWDDPRPRYSCGSLSCSFCCMDEDGLPCLPQYGGDQWP